MLHPHEINTLAMNRLDEQVEARRFDRLLRNKRAKEAAERNLRREIERLLEADGNIQSVLDVLENVAAKTRASRSTSTACCS